MEKPHFFDRKFLENKWKYLSQCFIAMIAAFGILFSLNILPNAAVIVSIGATTFTVFAAPHRRNSHERFIIGGYLCGMFCGILCSYLASLTANIDLFIFQMHNVELLGALAVALTMLLMVTLNLEHGPGAALALGLVIDDWTIRTLLVTVIAIFLILSYRHLFRKHLIDLL